MEVNRLFNRRYILISKGVWKKVSGAVSCRVVAFQTSPPSGFPEGFTWQSISRVTRSAINHAPRGTSSICTAIGKLAVGHSLLANNFGLARFIPGWLRNCQVQTGRQVRGTQKFGHGELPLCSSRYGEKLNCTVSRPFMTRAAA